MSDRPMRLKYLTKMKIILCIFLLCITAVSVFGQSVELNSVVGGSVKFPAAVKIEGNLIYSGEVAPIGVVTSGRFTTPRDGRLQWDSSTGLFYLSGLRVEDSGIYTVQDTQQTPVSTFNLTVWEGNVPVSKPQVSFTHDEYPCTILCAAARGTEVTLSWYREGQKKPYGSYPVRSAPDLYLPQTVHKGGIYTCEAKNSVSNEKASITVGDHCTGSSAGTIAAIIIAVVAVVIVALIAVVFAVLYHRTNTVTRQGQHKLAVIYDNFKMLVQGKIILCSAPYDDNYVDPRTLVDKFEDPYTWAVGSLNHAVGSLNHAVGSLNHVKEILEKVDPLAFRDAVQRVPQSGDAVQPVPQSDIRSKDPGSDMSDRKNEQGREEGSPPK